MASIKGTGSVLSRVCLKLMRYSEPERRWEISGQRQKTDANMRRISEYPKIQTQCGVAEAVSHSQRGLQEARGEDMAIP